MSWMESILDDATEASRLLERIASAARMSGCGEVERLRSDVEHWRGVALRLERERKAWDEERDRMLREAGQRAGDRWPVDGDEADGAMGYKRDIE